MASLRNLQLRLCAAIKDGNATRVLPLLAPGATSRCGLATYRNNAACGTEKTLISSYPVIHRLVGERCFASLAHDYAQQYPSVSGNLFDFGVQFPAHLDSRYAGGPFEYLSDVARLERACEEALTSAHEASLNPRQFVDTATDAHPDLRLRIHPTVRLVSSSYPILAIWQANEPGADDSQAVRLDAGGECLLVSRTPQSGMLIRRLSPSTYGLLSALLRGDLLGDALEAQAGVNGDFDPARALVSLFEFGVVTGVCIARPPQSGVIRHPQEVAT